MAAAAEEGAAAEGEEEEEDSIGVFPEPLALELGVWEGRGPRAALRLVAAASMSKAANTTATGLLCVAHCTIRPWYDCNPVSKLR